MVARPFQLNPLSSSSDIVSRCQHFQKFNFEKQGSRCGGGDGCGAGMMVVIASLYSLMNVGKRTGRGACPHWRALTGLVEDTSLINCL